MIESDTSGRWHTQASHAALTCELGLLFAVEHLVLQVEISAQVLQEVSLVIRALNLLFEDAQRRLR